MHIRATDYAIESNTKSEHDKNAEHREVGRSLALAVLRTNERRNDEPKSYYAHQ
jgi:hypothetical protein